MAGVSLFPQSFTVAPAAMGVGIIAAITGKYRWATWFGWSMTTLGMGLLLILDVDTKTAVWVIINIVGGIGTGCLFAAMGLATQAASNNGNMAYAVILFAFFRAFGQAVGVALGGVVFQNALKDKLMKFPLLAPHALEYSKDSSGLVQLIKSLPAGLEKTQLQESYMSGLKAIYLMCTVLAAVAFIASWWTEALPLDRAFETDQGFQYQKKDGDEESKKSGNEEKVET
jgi:hypothetical protein